MHLTHHRSNELICSIFSRCMLLKHLSLQCFSILIATFTSQHPFTKIIHEDTSVVSYNLISVSIFSISTSSSIKLLFFYKILYFFIEICIFLPQNQNPDIILCRGFLYCSVIMVNFMWLRLTASCLRSIFHQRYQIQHFDLLSKI